MEILIGVVLVFFGAVLGRWSKCDVPDYMTQLSTFDYEKESLRNENRALMEDVRRCRMNHHGYCSHVCNQMPCVIEKRVYAQSIREQEIVDLLSKSVAPMQELMEKLGMEAPKKK